MISVKTGLVALTASGALAASAVLLAAPAYADTLRAPAPPTTCFEAQTDLTNAQHQLALAEAADRSDDNPALAGSADFTPDAADLKVTEDQAIVNVYQGYVNALCGTGTTGAPTPTPTPGPVGLPILTCAQLAARGLHDIPRGSVYYRGYLDRDHDGIACETTPTPTPTPVSVPVGTLKVINGKDCRWDGTKWVPVTPVTVIDPNCHCDPTPAPATVVLRPAPKVTQTIVQQAPPQTIVEQAPVTVPPAQVFLTPQAPSVGAVATGDGSLAAVLDPAPNPDPITVTLSVGLGDLLQIIQLPPVPAP